MEINIFEVCYLGLITIMLVGCALFTLKGKGVILTYAYLSASAKEREKIKEVESKKTCFVFGGLSIAFGLLTLQGLTLWGWINILACIVMAIVSIYWIYITAKGWFLF